MCYILNIPVRYKIMDYSSLFFWEKDVLNELAGKRSPVLFCLDVSASMNSPVGDSAKTTISELNEGLQWFFRELQSGSCNSYIWRKCPDSA